MPDRDDPNPAADLGQLQRWMAAVVRHRERAAGAVDAASHLIAARDLHEGKVLATAGKADPLTRLDVYNGGYLARLRDALMVDFPGLAHALGEEGFLELVAGYVDQYPSTHPNLNQLGRHLPAHIDAQRDLQGRAFLHDLARLELAMTHAFDAPPFEPFDMTSLQGLSEDQWATVVLRPNPSLQVMAFDHPANGWLQAFFDEKPIAFPQPAPHRLAVYRKDYQVFRLGLPEEIFAILSALVSGEPFGAALAAGGEHEHDLSHWFQQWAADGFFIAVDGID